MLDSMRVLESEGFKVTYLPVNKNGLLDLKVSLIETFLFISRDILFFFVGTRICSNTRDKFMFSDDGQQ